MRNLLFCLLALCLSQFAVAQLPPSFASSAIFQKDPLDRAYITPTRIVWTSDSGRNMIQNAEVLLRPGVGQSDMASTPKCSMENRGNAQASIILDFGREIHGGLQLIMGMGNSTQPTQVRLRFGESVAETCSDLFPDWKVGFATNDHAMRDMVVDIPRDGSMEIGNTGFRFVRIDILPANRKVVFKEIRAILRYRDIPYQGTFKCNDERLNTIWATAAYTTHLNMQEFLWDGIKRDRTIWLGDMHPEVATINYVFGANPIVPATLEYANFMYPLPGWMNGMSNYSLWWIVIQHDWYMHHGDLNFLKTQKDYLTGLVRQILAKVKEDGSADLSGFPFLDWPASPNAAGVKAGTHALIVWALQDAIVLCKALGETGVVQECEAGIERLRKGVLPHNGLKQAAALMSLAGTMDAEKAASEVLSVGGSKGFSTFYGFYMLQAQAKAGHYQQALDVIREYWGGMVDAGATTFWEDFDLEWARGTTPIDAMPVAGKKNLHGDFGAYCYPGYRLSLCHGWSSGPAPWLSEHVLGFQVVEPGCRVVRIAPHLGDLEWAEGTFPTPYGVIKVSHKKGPGGQIESKIDAPRQIRILR